ncbi:TetR family transcriptional regulator [Nocardia sp. NPDC049707]|uniref:TetR/AcrR family transcriptional regulator n=1 Tax=Nocardia sp. NPDC049707 TaxID=3154735 RepID=UPI00342E4DEC
MSNPSAPTSRAEQRRNTEARILAHARTLFAESGYDRTTIRAVATGAGVDPGLVIHYFGSKQQLFLSAIGSGSALLAGGSAADIAEQLLDRLRDSMIEEPVTSLAMLRSMLTHPEAAEEIRTSSRIYKDQISGAIPGEEADLRAEVVSAALLGIVLCRHLVKLDHLTEADPDRVVEILRPVVRSITKADIQDSTPAD